MVVIHLRPPRFVQYRLKTAKIGLTLILKMSWICPGNRQDIHYTHPTTNLLSNEHVS